MNRDVIRKYLDAYTSFDIDGMLALLSDDVHFRNYLDDQLTVESHGKDKFKEIAEGSKDLFATREQKLVSVRSDDDNAVAVVEFKGTLAKDFENGPKAGTEIHLVGKSEFQFRDGLICSIVDRA